MSIKNLFTKKSSTHGKGLFTKVSIKKGGFVAYIHGPIVSFKTLTPTISKNILDWIGVGRHSWIDTSTSPFRFINHSCDPNTVIVGQRKVIALKNIEKEEELTMDYSLTDAEEGWGLKQCFCGAKTCRHFIGPINTVPLNTYKKYLPYISKKFQKIYRVDTGYKQ